MSVTELHAFCQRAAAIAQSALGLSSASTGMDCSRNNCAAADGAHAVAAKRWGMVPNLFEARLHRDGSTYLQACRETGSDAAGTTCPMGQPEVCFVQDWPMQDAQWRQLDATMLWPSMQRTLAALNAGAPRFASRSTTVLADACTPQHPGWTCCSAACVLRG